MAARRPAQRLPQTHLPKAIVERAVVRGKFLFAGEEKLWVRGVTYGTFRPDESGNEFHQPAVVERDFAQMAANGVNAVRVYAPPPPWLLDLAATYGLRVMVGLPWEQHVTFLDDRRRRADIVARLRKGVTSCAGHPAVLCFAVGNEIPAPIVRWYGPRRITRFLRDLCDTVKDEDPTGLVTYVNFPSTEYLETPFCDLVCFNVYLEAEDRFAAYLQRVHNLAGDRPVLMAEIGLDSLRHGEAAQARTLEWQLRGAFRIGCGGAFVFAWTDEWHRGGHDIDDWRFGLTTRERRPKLALRAVQQVFAEVPFTPGAWPRVSVVVCSFNGARTICETLDGLQQLDYPNFEVIVVDDGSTDRTAELASAYDVNLIRTENRGLSSARNTGLQAASGEIVAYIDDDAYPDPDWLKFLVATFMGSDHAGAGGPNLATPSNGVIADCLANAPGGPTHVLLSDGVAEHLPGCNMAFRKSCLEMVGGFDPRFRVAGDDVDLCWRLQERGWTLGYSPAAMVWHHRRQSLRGYWRQQLGYGKAEALLEGKWPAKYDAIGHLSWQGRIYGVCHSVLVPRRSRIYHGVWGSALFQRMYHSSPGTLAMLPLMPEWVLVILILATLSALGTLWPPLLLCVPLFGAALGMACAVALAGAAKVRLTGSPASAARHVQLRALTAGLFLLQPIARLVGRLRHGLTPWRRRGEILPAWPAPAALQLWDEQWCALDARLTAIEQRVVDQGAIVRRGGDYDRWDLEIRGGLCGRIRTLSTIEEHGAGKQLLRLRAWPKVPVLALATISLASAGAVAAALDHAWVPAAVLGIVTAALAAHALGDCAAAMGMWRRAVGVDDTAGAALSSPDQAEGSDDLARWSTEAF